MTMQVISLARREFFLMPFDFSSLLSSFISCTTAPGQFTTLGQVTPKRIKMENKPRHRNPLPAAQLKFHRD
jgi:hypothetical protein